MTENTLTSLDFEVTLFNDQSFNGTFTFDPSIITGVGEELTRIEDDQGNFELALNIFGETFTEEDDVDFAEGDPPFPFATFNDGEIQGIDFLPASEDVGTEGFGGFFIRQAEILFVEDAYFDVAGQGIDPVPVAGFETELVGLVSYEGQTFTTIAGTDEDDILVGTNIDNRIFPRDGDDLVTARRGDDLIRSGEGNDSLNGSLGDDTLIGEDGIDLLRGGRGDDVLQGGDGDDLLLGQLGDDTLEGGNNRDTLIGGNGNDSLLGDAGSDVLLGRQGDDTLSGSSGRDSLTGGAGADQFAYNTGDAFSRADLGRTQILDFTVGLDKIALGIVTFDTLESQVGDGFSIGSDFAVVTGILDARQSEAGIVYQSTTGNLYYNQNGAERGFGSGGLFATLTTIPELNVTDFVLQ